MRHMGKAILWQPRQFGQTPFRASIDGDGAVRPGEREEPRSYGSSKALNSVYNLDEIARPLSENIIICIDDRLECLSDRSANLKVLAVCYSEYIVCVASASHCTK